jgi:hypothetical protein
MVERRGEWTERHAGCGELSWAVEIRGNGVAGVLVGVYGDLWFFMSI